MNATRLAVINGGMVDTRVAAAAAPVTLTVLNFQNRQKGDGYEWLQRAFPDMLLTHFVQHGKFTVVERERMQVLLDELKLAQTGVTRQDEAAKFAGIAKVQKVVYGHYAVEHGRLSVTAFVFDAISNTVDAVATAEGGLDSLCDIEHQLFSNLLGRLGAPLTEKDQGRLRCVVSSSLSAAAHFYDGLSAFDAGDYPEALLQFLQAGQQDPRYGEARLWAARMYSYLGEPMHAVIELRQFTSDLPEHPLTAQARLRTGLTLLQDLQQPRLAATEFEQLIAMEPAIQESPVALRQAHWDEYLMAFRGKWAFDYGSSGQRPSQSAIEIWAIGRERAQRLDIFLEGWYRLGQCYEMQRDAGKAFDAYDHGRAVCRWLLLDQSGLTRQLYDSAYGAYQQLLRTVDSTVPIPDWVCPIDGDKPRTIFCETEDQMYRYLLKPMARDPAVVLLAPLDRQFMKLTAQAYGEGGSHPLQLDYRPNVRAFMGAVYPPHSESINESNCLTVTTKLPPFDAYRACEVEAWRLDNNRDKLATLTVSASYAAWMKIIPKPRDPLPPQVLVYCQPTNAILRIDGKVAGPSILVVSPIPPGFRGYYLSAGPHRFELADESGRTATSKLSFEPGRIPKVFLFLTSPWQDTGVRLPPGRTPDLCRATDGQYWLVFVAAVRAGLGQPETGDDIWLAKSRDLHQWSQPVRLPINSPQEDTAPCLMVLPDGRMQLAFISTRRQSGAPGIYISQSTDGNLWSPPRRLGDAQSSIRTMRSADERYWLCSGFAVWESSDGVNWKAAALPDLRAADPESVGEADNRLLTLPTKNLAVRCSRVIELPDGSVVVAASESDKYWLGRNTYIFEAKAEDLRRAITEFPPKVDHQ